jgi:hypothetical protein
LGYVGSPDAVIQGLVATPAMDRIEQGCKSSEDDGGSKERRDESRRGRHECLVKMVAMNVIDGQNSGTGTEFPA